MGTKKVFMPEIKKTISYAKNFKAKNHPSREHTSPISLISDPFGVMTPKSKDSQNFRVRKSPSSSKRPTRSPSVDPYAFNGSNQNPLLIETPKANKKRPNFENSSTDLFPISE